MTDAIEVMAERWAAEIKRRFDACEGRVLRLTGDDLAEIFGEAYVGPDEEAIAFDRHDEPWLVRALERVDLVISIDPTRPEEGAEVARDWADMEAYDETHRAGTATEATTVEVPAVSDRDLAEAWLAEMAGGVR